LESSQTLFPTRSQIHNGTRNLFLESEEMQKTSSVIMAGEEEIIEIHLLIFWTQNGNGSEQS
jgi:hypothetical protein